MAEDKKINFWDTVSGGPHGYLLRCQESLRSAGVNFADQNAVTAHLGLDVYQE